MISPRCWSRLAHLSPVDAVPYPGILEVGSPRASKHHHLSARIVIRHRMAASRGRPGVGYLGPVIAVPDPGVATVLLLVGSPKQYDPMPCAVIHHGVAHARRRT